MTLKTRTISFAAVAVALLALRLRSLAARCQSRALTVS
jgi:hypothetical protein